MVKDACGKDHQLGTVQLDFQLPKRFDLKYQDSIAPDMNVMSSGDVGEKGMEGLKTPVLIHRAILGSIERCLALLIETSMGKWPFWISPRQIIILPLIVPNSSENGEGLSEDEILGYTRNVLKTFKREGFFVDVEYEGSLGKRIRDSESIGYNYCVIIGANEVSSRTLSFRERGGKRAENISLEAILEKFRGLCE